MNKVDENGNKQGYWELEVGPNFYTKKLKLTLKGTYVDNALEGEYKYYYENGNIESEGVCKGGAMDGEIKFYHKNGKLSSIGNYIPISHSNGRFSRPQTKVGVHYRYDSFGDLINTNEYKNGRIIQNN